MERGWHMASLSGVTSWFKRLQCSWFGHAKSGPANADYFDSVKSERIYQCPRCLGTVVLVDKPHQAAPADNSPQAGNVGVYWTVTGDHPVLARPDKYNLPKDEADAYADELRGHGYENVSVCPSSSRGYVARSPYDKE